jgi:hypothetical protein
MSAGGAAECLAVAGFMRAECDSVRRLLEEGREACLAVDQRQGREVFAVEIEEIEDEINEAGAAAIGGLLHELKGGHAVWANAAELAVKIGGFDLKRLERVGGPGILRGPVEPGTGEKLDGALIDPGGDAVAVELDLVDPPGSARGFCRELAKLRLDPFRRRHLENVTRGGLK